MKSWIFLAMAALAASLTSASESTDSSAPIRFEELGARAGVRHRHSTRRFAGKHGDVLRMFTSGGAAAAAGDFDNDGFDDLFVTNSDTGKPNKLFRNQGEFRFVDVTARAGVAAGNDPHSIVADALFFDYDNDGWQDLLVARFGTPLLYHNEQDGTFKDVSSASGLNRFANTISVIAFDYDRDGLLDLLLGHYFKAVNLLDLKQRQVLPDNLDNAHNGGGVGLWRNRGQGRFEEVTEQAGLGGHSGWTLDVGHGDFDNDGWPDLYLACDYGTDRIFFNNGDGTFRDATQESLGGFDTKKGMNAEVADYNNDGFFDVYVTNITDEYMKECNMLWFNNGDQTFTDLSKETGTCDTLWGWSAKFADFDNDGWQDLYAVNGLRSAGEKNYIPVLFEMIITPEIDFSDVANWPDIGKMSWSGYQKSKLFLNLSGEIFREISAEAGVDNDLDGRGVALADFDQDGLTDIYQTNADQPALLYRNTTANPGNWLELRLIGDPQTAYQGHRSSRDAVGARLSLKVQGQILHREVQGGNGYSGQSSKFVHFGLGTAQKIDSLTIRWPSGRVEAVEVPLNEFSTLLEGKGRVKRAATATSASKD